MDNEIRTWLYDMLRSNIIYAVFITALFSSIASSGQETRHLKGKFILDGSPAPGANMHVKGSLDGSTTDINGEFSLMVPREGKFTLVIGMCICTTHHEISIKENENDILITFRKCKPVKKRIN